MQAYNPSTKTVTTQTVQQVFINHDTDLIDVTLAVQPTKTQSKPQQVAVVSHGSHAPPATTEVVHTTQKHPWLTTTGWVTAGQLHVGDHVQQLDGSTATVVGLKIIAGSASMYDLTVSNVHTFAVGDGQFIVHNCDDEPPNGWTKEDYGPDNKPGVTDFTHVDEAGNELQATLFHDSRELQIPWMDSLRQAKDHLPDLVNWLGDSVQTIKGYVSDNFAEHFSPGSRGLSSLTRMFSSALGGFDQGTLEPESAGKLWIVFRRLVE